MLEVFPLSARYTGFDPVKAAAPAASDFEAIPVDLLLYPRSKVEERRHWLSHLIAQAHREGRVLDGPR